MGNRKLWLTLLVGLATAAPGLLPAQTKHRILAVGNRFYLEERGTGRRERFDMWNIRLANALFDQRFTDQIIANLDDYLRYGVNTLSVGIQGGHMGSTTYNQLYPRVYNSDGTLITSSPVWANLKRLLAETDRRGMVLIIQYWYFRRDQNVPTESAVLKATRNVTQWLKNTGHRNYILDLVNEFGHSEYKGRSIFSTVTGALKLLEAVYQVDPDVLAGMSPPGRLFAPEGYLNGKWVEARIIYNHNQPLDPTRSSSYYLHGLPKNPLGKPYVNNEFNAQLGYDRYPKKNPKTGKYSYGHWDQATINNYLLDLVKVRRYGGYGNIFSHRLQYLTDPKGTPIAFVGPEGTQPESSPGAGEPSLHWLFSAIARMNRFGPLAVRHDFSQGLAAGVEFMQGTWRVAGGRLTQTDAQADPAWARLVADQGDLEITFEASFLGTPTDTSRIGVFLGEANPQGKGYRLLIGRNAVSLDQPGGKLPATSVRIRKRPWDRYTLRCRGGRVEVEVNGRLVISLDDLTPVQGANVLFLTRKVGGLFDNIRVNPYFDEDFNDEQASPWWPADPGAWTFVRKPGTGGDVAWQVTAAKSTEHAALELRLGNCRFSFEARFASAQAVGVRFRAQDLASAAGDGYVLTLGRQGEVLLHCITNGKVITLAEARASFNPERVEAAVTASGPVLAASVNGREVLRVRDTRFRRGGLAVFATKGQALFDNFTVETAPNLAPSLRFEVLGNQLVLEASDPDGMLDFQDIRLYVNQRDGHGFHDVSYVFQPQYGLVTLQVTPDQKGGRAVTTRGLRLLGRPWTLRLVAIDHAGNAVEEELELDSVRR